MNLIQRVEEAAVLYGGGTRKNIGEFILKEKSHLYRYSIQEIADATYTSKAALVRFAKELGFSGWRAFLKAFVEEQKYQESHYTDIVPNFPFTAQSSRQDIINQICSLQVESILDTADLLDHAPLDEAVDLLKRSRRIGLFGISPNSLLGELFARKMLSIGRVVDIPVQGTFGLLASSLGEDDCAIIVSYSGNSGVRETGAILPILQGTGVPIIAITSAGENLLRSAARYTFSISSRERLYSKISTFATENSILYILNVLFSCYFARDYEANLDRKLHTSQLLEQERRTTIPALLEQKKEPEHG